MVVDNWNVNMQEMLDPRDARLTLLGDRGDGARSFTEEAWRATHAAATWVVYASRIALRNAETASQRACHSPAAMMRRTRKLLQDILQARHREALQSGNTAMAALKQAWLETGAGIITKDKTWKACTLSRAPGATPVERADAMSAIAAAKIEQYVDGAWDPENKKTQMRAGAGVAEFHLIATNAHSPAAETEFQRGPGQTEDRSTYDLRQAHAHGVGPPRKARLTWAIGTTVADCWHGRMKNTNNTGELTALHLALKRAEKRGVAAPHEIIWVDSLYARNMTLGEWMPQKQKNLSLIRRLRNTWKRVQARRGMGKVRIEHLHSHVVIPGNELADKLASQAIHCDPHEGPIGTNQAKQLMRGIALVANSKDPRVQRQAAPGQEGRPGKA